MKPIIRQEVPQYDQCTQYVVELEPVEYEDHVYVGCEVREMEVEVDDGNI